MEESNQIPRPAISKRAMRMRRLGRRLPRRSPGINLIAMVPSSNYPASHDKYESGEAAKRLSQAICMIAEIPYQIKWIISMK
jgi:hypothetical protein